MCFLATCAPDMPFPGEAAQTARKCEGADALLPRRLSPGRPYRTTFEIRSCPSAIPFELPKPSRRQCCGHCANRTRVEFLDDAPTKSGLAPRNGRPFAICVETREPASRFGPQLRSQSPSTRLSPTEPKHSCRVAEPIPAVA